MELAEELAGHATSFIRVLTHPYTGARLGMDRQVCKPPGSRQMGADPGRQMPVPRLDDPAHLADIDHAREWQDGGATEDGNLVTPSRPIHLAKSHGLIDEELQDSGIVGWNDTWGNHFTDPPPDPLDPAPPDLLPPGHDDEPAPFCHRDASSGR
jgi:hypothetical protein